MVAVHVKTTRYGACLVPLTYKTPITKVNTLKYGKKRESLFCTKHNLCFVHIKYINSLDSRFIP
jgi:hypothetical protein